ncbi:hypothetical protein QYE76_058619 [Lolium multiflorum]|uniref:CCHC-type domain-containing protein n=1 Tax=Lolium multiflorum TaxID=4521 RepID=A0AAD8T6T0_LOLMU|nr:hypothetical protein QYE76_058619 [Lolium multiflorum]
MDKKVRQEIAAMDRVMKQECKKLERKFKSTRRWTGRTSALSGGDHWRERGSGVNGRGRRGGSEWEIPGGSGAVHLPRGSSNLLHKADDLECEQAELLVLLRLYVRKPSFLQLLPLVLTIETRSDGVGAATGPAEEGQEDSDGEPQGAESVDGLACPVKKAGAKEEERKEDGHAETKQCRAQTREPAVLLAGFRCGEAKAISELTMAGFADALRPDKFTDGKELWDALNAKFGATDAGSELYIMESFHDIRMVNNRSVVEQAHEIQCIAKELELLKCALPDKFVAGCIIAKLPPSWRNFATTLKHKRQEISVENLIASLDVEEKARAKDNEKGEGQSSANMVQKKPYSKNKGNNKPSFNKPMKTTTFKKKKMINKADLSCFTCGETGHFSKDCPERADRKKKARQVNSVTASNADGYGNLFTVARDSSVLMGNGSHASVRGVGTVDLKFTSGRSCS